MSADTVLAYAESLRGFIRQRRTGGCRILTFSVNCPCPATLTARRAAAVEEAVAGMDQAAAERFYAIYHDVHNPGLSHLKRGILAALFPRGPDAATGTGEGMDRANIAEAALRLMAEGGPQESFQCNYIAREILTELTRLRTALAAAERAGAEKYRHEIVSRIGSGDYPWPTNLSALDKALSAIHAALFPPPGAEVGRG